MATAHPSSQKVNIPFIFRIKEGFNIAQILKLLSQQHK